MLFGTVQIKTDLTDKIFLHTTVKVLRLFRETYEDTCCNQFD